VPDHYGTLGVQRDASDAEIKAAFRRLASQNHPDRDGGDAERMQAINAAHACLGDPGRRQHYDRTGNDQCHSRRIDQQALQMVLSAFSAAIDAGVPRDLVGAVTTGVTNRRAEIEAQVAGLHRQVAKLQGKRDRVLAKVGANLYQQLVDGRLAQIDREVAECEDMLLIIDAGLTMLKNYESNDPAEDQILAAAQDRSVLHPFESFGGTAASSGWWR